MLLPLQGAIAYEMAATGNGIGYFVVRDDGVVETARSFNRSQRNVFVYNVSALCLCAFFI